jgi:hypothetical protein
MAVVAAVLGALAIGAPIADAATPGNPGFSLDAAGTYAGFPFDSVPLSFPVGPELVAIGPTVINDVFNGATVVISSNEAAYSSVVASP